MLDEDACHFGSSAKMKRRLYGIKGEFSFAAQGAGQQKSHRAHDHGERDQDHSEAERQWEIAFAGLQRNGRGHGAGVAADVAADDDNGADLRNGPAESREKGREQSAASNDEQLPQRAGFG